MALHGRTRLIRKYPNRRLYDTEETKELVIRKIANYKEYRDILNADIIHLRRPDGRDWDGILHVDPQLDIKGYALLYNPTGEVLERTIRLPLYYTGLTNTAQVQIGDRTATELELERDFSVEIQVHIPAHGYQNILIR